MKITTLWPLAERAARVVAGQYESSISGVAAQFGLDITLLYGFLLVVKIFEPDPITVERLRVRAPYASPKLYAERLANTAAAGFLRPVGRHGYVLTEKGNQVINKSIQVIYGRLAQWTLLPAERLARLVTRLWKLVEASLAASEPPGHWCIAHSRKLDPGPGAAEMVRIDQYLSDLAAYRDDAHLASWQDYGIDGAAWDALTCLWRESPLSLDDITNRLKRRGYDKNDYAARFEELMHKGWVGQTGEVFSILLPGRDVRQAAENLTDEYFYRPWECLSDPDFNELEDLLTNLASSVAERST